MTTSTTKAIKRKWFSSMQEMIDKGLETRTEEPPHDVYCCELETKHSDKSITKVMCVIQRDYDVLYEAIESLVAEQKNVLRSKSRHDYVLYMLQLKIIRAEPDGVNKRVFWTATVIISLVDPEETKKEPYYLIVNDSLKAHERRSDEEYENAECIYKVDNLMNEDEMKKLTEWRKARYFDV